MVSYRQLRRLKVKGKLTGYFYVRAYDCDLKKQCWISTRCTSLKAAREWVKSQELREAVGPERREKQEKVAMTFRQAYSAWLSEQAPPVVSPQRFETVKLRGDHFWLGFFADKKLQETKRDDIREYLRKRRLASILHPQKKKVQRLKKPAAATLNNDIRDLRTFFSFCLMNEWIDRTPMLGIQNVSGEMRRRVRTLAPEEEARLVAACRESIVLNIAAKRNQGGRRKGVVSTEKSEFRQAFPAKSYLAPLVVLALNCGFRRRTLLSLRWRDVDLEAAHWEIPGEFMKTAADYIAPVPEMVVQELKEYRKVVAAECEKAGIPPIKRLARDAAIFGLKPNSSFLRGFKAAAMRAGLEGLTFHDCRRIYLNKLRERKVSLETTMALTGHKSVATVMKHYREVPQSDLEEAVATLAGPKAASKASESSPPQDKVTPTPA